MMQFRKQKSRKYSNQQNENLDTTADSTNFSSNMPSSSNHSEPFETEWEPETLSLTEEEAAEIREAFQQVLEMERLNANELNEPTSLESMLELTAASESNTSENNNWDDRQTDDRQTVDGQIIDSQIIDSQTIDELTVEDPSSTGPLLLDPLDLSSLDATSLDVMSLDAKSLDTDGLETNGLEADGLDAESTNSALIDLANNSHSVHTEIDTPVIDTPVINTLVVAVTEDTDLNLTTDNLDTANLEPMTDRRSETIEPVCDGFSQSAQEIEQITLAVNEADLITESEPELAAEPLLPELEPLLPEPLLPEPLLPTPLLSTESMSYLDSLMVSDVIDSPVIDSTVIDSSVIDTDITDSSINRSASFIETISLVDVGIESDELADEQSALEHQAAGPLTYFHYYLDDEGSELTDEGDAAPYNAVTWRQPSLPAGLIGAGVLGATLISGFMIADSLKQPTASQAKKPSPSPLQASLPQSQSTAVATPKPAAPELMQPEVPLPPPPNNQPVPMMGAGSMITPAAPPFVMGAGANPAPMINSIGMGAGQPVAQPETLPMPPAPKVSSVETTPVAKATAPTIATQQPTFEQVESKTLEVPAVPPSPSGVSPSGIEPAPDSQFNSRPGLPTLEPGATNDGISNRAADLGSPDTQASTRPSTQASTQASTQFPPMNEIKSEVQSPDRTADRTAIEQTSERPVVVPTEPTEFVFQPEQNQTKTSAPPAVSVPVRKADNPIAPTGLPVKPELQSLLTAPAPAFTPNVASLRSLTQEEATAVAQSNQLGAFSRQTLSPQEYIQAYQLVSQELNALPPFGFIDYQRQMILLPAEVEASLRTNPGIRNPQS